MTTRTGWNALAQSQPRTKHAWDQKNGQETSSRQVIIYLGSEGWREIGDVGHGRDTKKGGAYFSLSYLIAAKNGGIRGCQAGKERGKGSEPREVGDR